MNYTNTNIQLATVTDKSFFQGTLVMLNSFLYHNQWFDGNILIIEDDLDDFMKEVLSLFPKVEFIEISERLKERLDLFEKVLPHYALAIRKFYILETFRLDTTDQLLYLDSDMLCLNNIKSLLSINNCGLVAAPDKSYYLGEQREEKTFVSYPMTEQLEGETYLDCFNSGMLLVNYTKLKPNVYDDILSFLSPMKYAEVKTGHGDQYLLNRFFKSDYHKVSAAYNYMLHCEKAIYGSTGILPSEASLLHYVKSTKPWMSNSDETSFSYVQWSEAYIRTVGWIQSRSMELFGEMEDRYGRNLKSNFEKNS